MNRGNNARAVRSLSDAGELMKRLKISLMMFPEGTRTSSEVPDMRPLKKGGFHLAIQAGIPIIPVVTENYWRLYHKGVFDEGTIKTRGGLASHVNTVLCRADNFLFLFSILSTVLPPIPTIGLTASDIPELATRVRNQMLEALHEMSIVLPGRPEQKIQEKTSHDSLNPTLNLLEEESSPPTVDPEPSMISDQILEPTSGSSMSIASSFGSSAVSSEKGTETEEDEGMILVVRPS